jgi:hypothetical protein
MDFTSLIAIIVAIIAIYIFIRFILSPIIKIILGVVIFLSLIYLLKRFFGLDLNDILTSLSTLFNKFKN